MKKKLVSVAALGIYNEPVEVFKACQITLLGSQIWAPYFEREEALPLEHDFVSAFNCVVYFQFPKIFKRLVSGHLKSYRHGTVSGSFLLKFYP